MLHSDQESATLASEGRHFTLTTKKPLHEGQKATILVRPEDLRVERREADVVSPNHLGGIVQEVIYKGTTIDLQIALPSGRLIMASEFYNEDSDALDYRIGEEVFVAWVQGWEVVLEECPDA